MTSNDSNNKSREKERREKGRETSVKVVNEQTVKPNTTCVKKIEV